MPDSLLSLVAHPLPVVAHVLGQTLRAAPRLRDDRWLALRFRVHRRPAGELRRNLDHRLVDQHRHRVEVAGMGFETQPLRFERQGTAAGERVVECRQRVAVEQLGGARVTGVLGARSAPALPDLGSRPLQHLLVGRVLPQNQLFENPEQARAFEFRRHVTERRRARRRLHRSVRLLSCPDVPVSGRWWRGRGRCASCQALLQLPLRGALLPRIRQKHVDVLRRVVDHLREDHRTRRRQWPARPPQVQRRRMPMANGLLARRRSVDRGKWQRHLDQLFPHRRALPGIPERPSPYRSQARPSLSRSMRR